MGLALASEERVKVLLIGAGAVGQVYGWHLSRGGAEVHVFVKRRHADAAHAGFPLYPPGATTPETWRPAGVHTDPAELAAIRWDQAWLCIPSDALAGDWLPELVPSIGDATLVSLLPGLRDRDRLAAIVPAERLVLGMIAFSAWWSPIRGETRATPGTAWWHPPLAPSTFAGPDPAVDAIVATLRKGGCPAAKGDPVGDTGRGAAFLTPLVAVLESVGWSFAALREGAHADLVARAFTEALTIACAYLGLHPGPMAWLARAWIVRLATRVVPLVAPMDFEAFLQVHFGKVGTQTRQQLDTWIEEGRARSLPVGAILAVRSRLS